MRIICDRKLLEEALNKAKEATEKKAALPILTNLLLTAEGEYLTIKATDLENYLTLKIPANVVEEGTTSVSSQKLTEIVKNGKCAELILNLQGENLLVECGRSKFKLTTIDPEEFPEFPEPQEDLETFILEGHIILEAIDRTDYAIPKDSENIVLNGLYVNGKGSVVDFVGTDGHRLALYRPQVDNFNLKFLLPKKSLKVLKKLIAKLDQLELAATENFAFIEGENWKLAVRLLEGDYPDYESVLPSETNYNALIPVEEFINALKRVTLLVEGKVKPVKITLMENLVKLEVSDPEFGEAEDEVEAEYVGETITAEFNARYIIEALDNYDSERIWFKLVDPDSPAVIEAENLEEEPYICLIMPMAI